MSRRYLRFDEALEILETQGNVEITGNGWYRTNCPAHDDEHPSMTFRIHSGDGVSFYGDCKAGCTLREIVEAIHRLLGDVVDPGARKMRKLLDERQEWKDKELAEAFDTTIRTMQRRLRRWKQDGLRWIRRSYSKVYDVSGWCGDTTPTPNPRYDTTQRERIGRNGEGDSSAAGKIHLPPRFLSREDRGGTNLVVASSLDEIYESSRAQNVVSRPIVDYDYRDPVTGRPLYIKRRYLDPKDFVWLHWNSKRKAWWLSLGYAYGAKTTEADLPLYNAYRLGRRDLDRPVFVVEGEKAADALTRLGFLAVCFAGGASTTNFGFKAYGDLTNRRVILWPDNDDAGRELMRRIEDTIGGRVRELAWVEPPVPEAGDAYDFIAACEPSEDPLYGGAWDAVMDLWPCGDDTRPDTTMYCGRCHWSYLRRVGSLCPNPDCVKNPKHKREYPWDKYVPEEQREMLALTAPPTIIWEDLLRREVRLLGCEYGCTHQEHQDDEVRMLIMLKALRAPRRLIHPQRPGFFGKERATAIPISDGGR